MKGFGSAYMPLLRGQGQLDLYVFTLHVMTLEE
jgi:hypothetical protein